MKKQPSAILIVDDDSRNIFALNLVLKSKGFRCLSATDGVSGLKMISEKLEIGVVLLDMMMPEMDGYECIAAIRQLPERGNMPVIAVTAQAMPGDREKCLAAGANDYISKPVNVDVLVGILTNYL
ncbi:response regulator [Mucilaginibacter gotjawali]|uniref:Sensor histidine kinase RcsC n=2 Tax=Mucilaginibacter gotjawali TaxID=1550579 RepID=A0A0X8X377_9SPHI|nr:response regulator [Mucilaginibacter gotjawali]MBB3058168.1 CheY-like chemotaxis protein [Mucilaginibacter gotjawali]BAU54877.1 Sensor histidine kinase RcsC [Mucilaginibacter gotjawali]